jgi:hypothetical protein
MILNQEAPPAKAAKYSEDGGHWYEYANGVWVPLYEPGGTFTLREARKLKKDGRNVVPSVTSYFKLLHKQMLVDWTIEQALWWAIRTPYDNSDVQEDWISRVKSTASGASMGAADLGTAIHDAIEKASLGEEYDAKYDVYVQAVQAKYRELGLKSIGPEACLGSKEHGYAGRCDDRCEGGIVIDYKSRKTRVGKKAATYETDGMQLSAYGFAQWKNEYFSKGSGYIFVISTTEPGRVDPVKYSGDELLAAFTGFCGLMQLWRYIKDFDPRVIDL